MSNHSIADRYSPFTVIPPQYINPNNLYDDYGAVHNQGLEYYHNNRNYFGTNLDSTIFDIADVTSDFLTTVNPDSVATNIKAYYFNQLMGHLSDIGNFDPVEVIQNSNFSTDAKNREFELFLVFSNFNNIETEILPLIDSIKSWESRVINDTNITSTEKKHMLIKGSIARHSAAFWHNQLTDPNSYVNEGHSYPEEIDEVLPNFFGAIGRWISSAASSAWNWIATDPFRAVVVTLTDATGFASGGVGTAIGSSLIVGAAL